MTVTTHLIPAAGAALLAVLATSAPALAQSHRDRDARHDVVTFADDQTTADARPAPRRREADIESVRASYRPHRLTLRVQYAALRRPGHAHNPIVGHLVRMRTSEGKEYSLSLVADRSNPHGDVWFDGGSAPRPTCRGVRMVVDYRADSVQASVPRHCLSSPRWVRVGVATSTLAPHSSRLWVDDARSDHVEEAITLGPRLRRG